MSILNDAAIPMGFGMALTQDMGAMERFNNMTESQKEEILNRARDVKSKKDMDSIVAELSGNEPLT